MLNIKAENQTEKNGEASICFGARRRLGSFNYNQRDVIVCWCGLSECGKCRFDFVANTGRGGPKIPFYYFGKPVHAEFLLGKIISLGNTVGIDHYSLAAGQLRLTKFKFRCGQNAQRKTT